jgi:hypothetical protein
VTKCRRHLLSLLVALVCSAALACTPSESADITLINGNIYTLNPDQPKAEAIAIQGDRILYVGRSVAVKSYETPWTERIDLEGRTVVPGLTDSHVHLSGVGFRELTLNLEGATSLNEMIERVRTEAADIPMGEWVTGRGWIEAQWDPPVFPTRHDLDRAAPDHPLWLTRADGHGAVANSKALEIAGVSRTTKDPSGGEVMRDARGEPTGMLLDRAKNLVDQHIPDPSDEREHEALVVGARFLMERGWTEVSIAGSSFDEVERIRRLQDEGDIKIRIYDNLRGPGADADRLLEQGAVQREHGGLFTLRGIKVVADGALGSQGAALMEDYADRTGKGLLLWTEDELRPLYERALREGIQIQTHAIGDRANRMILDLYEEAFEKVPAAERKVADPRWRIEHAQVVHPDDIPRFAALKVIPSMQASHAITDFHFARSRLGEERLKGAYAWKSMLNAGAIIAGGSDAPVEQGDPMIEFYAAVARKDLNGFSDEYWHPEEVLTREEALKALTLWPAYASFEEDVRGTIETGKWADLTVLSQDIMTVEAAAIPKTQNEMTIVAGKVVYRK